jgi:hypothetical protein
MFSPATHSPLHDLSSTSSPRRAAAVMGAGGADGTTAIATNQPDATGRAGKFPDVYLEETMTTILIIVVVLMLFGGGGYYGYRRW